MNTIDVIRKYFADGEVLHFCDSDAHALIEGDTYLRYRITNTTELWLGGDNGEVCLMCTNDDSERLETLIKTILNC